MHYVQGGSLNIAPNLHNQSVDLVILEQLLIPEQHWTPLPCSCGLYVQYTHVFKTLS